MTAKWIAGIQVLAFLLAAAAAAPALAGEFRADGGVWIYRVRGFIDNNGQRLDFNRDLGVGTQRDGFVALEYAHGPSWIPDVTVNYSRLGGSGATTTHPAVGPVVIPGGSVTNTSSAHFNDVDVSARYEIALGSVGVSPGLTLKALNGDIVTRDDASGAESRQSYREVFPMLHARVVWAPGRILRFAAQGNWIARGGDQAWEYAVSAEPRLIGPLGLYAGWQEKRYRVQSSGQLDARLSGMRLGVILSF